MYKASYFEIFVKFLSLFALYIKKLLISPDFHCSSIPPNGQRLMSSGYCGDFPFPFKCQFKGVIILYQFEQTVIFLLITSRITS